MAQQTFKADVVITQSAFYNNEYYILQIISYYMMCRPDGPFIPAPPLGFVGPSAPTLWEFGPFPTAFDIWFPLGILGGGRFFLFFHWQYFGDTLGIPWGYFRDTSGKYLKDILGIPWRYIGDTLGIPCSYFLYLYLGTVSLKNRCNFQWRGD